jgi:hypothetical protein
MRATARQHGYKAMYDQETTQQRDEVNKVEYTHLKVYILLPATRQSFLLRCPAAGTYYLQSYASASRKPMDQEVRVTQNLLTLVVSAGTATAASLPTAAAFAAIRRPAYLADLRSASIVSSRQWSISVEQTGAGAYSWLGLGSACPLPCWGRGDCEALGVAGSDPVAFAKNTCTYAAFPGSLAATPASYRYASQLNQAEELKIYGRGLTAHPLHIHANHMQFVSSVDGVTFATNPSATLFGEPGDWRDTWPALAGINTVRLMPADFTGEVMIHCHFLKHEDMGMMASIGVMGTAATNSQVSSTAAAAAQYSSTASNTQVSSTASDPTIPAPSTASAGRATVSYTALAAAAVSLFVLTFVTC